MADGGGETTSALARTNVPCARGSTGPVGDASSTRSSPGSGERKRSGATQVMDTINGPNILRFLFWTIALLGLVDAVVFVLWWDKRHPVVQQVLAGQAFEGFQRFAPGDNRTQRVLAELSGGTIGKNPKQRNCSTPSCLWLRKYLDTTYRRPDPCHDFYGHVCSLRVASVLETAAEELLARVAERLQDRFPHRNRSGKEEALEVPPHVRAFRDCTSDSDHAQEYTVVCDFRTLEAFPASNCNVRYPTLPLAVAEGFFQDNPVATVEQFAQHIARLVPQLRRDRSTWKRNPRCPAAMGGQQQAESFCRRLGQAASCHLKHGLNRGHEDVQLYGRLWNELYFAPFIGKPADRIVSIAHGSFGANGRELACLRVLEDFFEDGTMHVSEQVLSERAGNIRAMAARLVDAAQLALGGRVSAWMSRAKQGDRPEARMQLRDKYRAELDALTPVVGAAHGGGTESMFSWKAYYDKAQNRLAIPYGLLALTSLTTAGAQDDPIVTTLLMASTMRPLLPHPPGVYTWFESDSRHLTSVVSCFMGAHNLSVDLAREVAFESALLTPLFDVYRTALATRADHGTRLHPKLDNGKIFYLLWAAANCGRHRASDVVVTAAKNSARFARTFGCTVLEPLWSNQRCNFWAYW